ncbi:MAG: hypothetical protein H9535_08730 [Ignavibacteria bacterium]|nr:hypothetical protein [Ignavibacteria bacterium]
MKDCIVKVLVVFVLGLLTLSRMYAQDTTITIYGKKFAPGVIVKINNHLVDSTNIKRDSAQPSRILYVKFLLSWLNKPASATVVAKDVGASLTSDEVENTVSVGNPGTAPTLFTIYTTPLSPKIVLKTEEGKILGSQEMPILQATSLFESDTTLVVRLEYSNFKPNSTLFFRTRTTTPPFEILDTNNIRLSNGFNLPSTEGFIIIHVRFHAQTGILRDTIKVDLKKTNNTSTTIHSFQCTGKRRIMILPFFTQKSSEPFIKIPTIGDVNTVYENVVQAQLEPSPADYLRQCLTILNNQILSETTIQDPLFYSQFEFVQLPTLIPYNEASVKTKTLHTDIDALPTLPKVQELDNQRIHCVLMLVNSDEAQYRAFATLPLGCNPCILPKYIVIEAKYTHTLIDASLMQVESAFFDDIKNLFR